MSLGEEGTGWMRMAWRGAEGRRARVVVVVRGSGGKQGFGLRGFGGVGEGAWFLDSFLSRFELTCRMCSLVIGVEMGIRSSIILVQKHSYGRS